MNVLNGKTDIIFFRIAFIELFLILIHKKTREIAGLYYILQQFLLLFSSF